MTVESAWLSRLSWVAIFSSESYLFWTWPGPGTVVDGRQGEEAQLAVSLAHLARRVARLRVHCEEASHGLAPTLAAATGDEDRGQENSALSWPGICMVR